MKVRIRPEVYAQIDYYVQKSDVEISGLGRVLKHDDGTMEVTKIYLLEQENGPATTDIDADAVAKLLFESRMDAELGNLNFWWHSHVNMGTFWSGTDMDTIKQFGSNGYILATVFNKKHEFRSAFFSAGTDFLPQIFVDNIATKITYKPSEAELESWEAEYTTKAKEKRYISQFPSWQNPNYKGNTFWDQWEESYEKENKETLLGTGRFVPQEYEEEEEDEWEELCQSYMKDNEMAEWNAYYCELKGKDPMDTSYMELWTFYELWDGDFKMMSDHVINQIAIKEAESDNLSNNRR